MMKWWTECRNGGGRHKEAASIMSQRNVSLSNTGGVTKKKKKNKMHKWSIKGALCAAVIICFHSGSVRWQFSRWHFQPLGAGTKPQRSTNTGTKQQASLLTRSSRATNKPAPFHLRQTSKSRRTFRLTSFTPLCVALAALRMAYLLPRPKYKHRQILCMQC